MGRWVDDFSEEDVLTERLKDQKLEGIKDIEMWRVSHINDCSACRIEFLSILNVSNTSLYDECQNCRVSSVPVDGVSIADILKEIEDDIWGTER